jgi:acetyl/propionyl-CoA carboxylase alpha subunit
MSGTHDYVLRAQDDPQLTLRFTLNADGSLTLADSASVPIKILRRESSGLLTVLWGDRVVSAVVSTSGERGDVLNVGLGGEAFALRLRETALDAMEQALAAAQQVGGILEVRSPIPGLVKAVSVKINDEVKAGQTVVVLEAMKMENEIIAPHGGIICGVEAQPGQAVAAGAVLVKIQT